MRAGLKPEGSVTALKKRLKKLATEILAALDENLDVSALLAEVRAATGRDDYDEMYFLVLADSGSASEFAGRAALGEPPMVLDLSRDEIAEIIRLIDASDPPMDDYYLGLLEKGLPNAEVSDLIFHPDRERTPEEMADEALLRVKLWKAGGLQAVRAHLVSLANDVRADPDAPLWAKQWAHSYRE